jgi:glycerol-3-phosphate dehydrogenase
MDLSVLIVGGGIHGVGLLHDLSTRRIQGVHLVESKSLASGTSSRSTKLVHGGLRYLEHLNQWSLVHEALVERGILLRVLKGIVTPLPIVLPAFRGDRPAWMLRAGLFLYDLLAGDGGLPAARSISKQQISQIAPYLKAERIEKDMDAAFLYYDAQMLDDVIVRLAATASVKLGNSYEENAQVISVNPTENRGEKGFRCLIQNQNGIREVTARSVVNAGGAWCNANLLQWGVEPHIACLLNVGTHFVFDAASVPQADLKKSAASLLQNHDGRVLFFIPWNGHWLFGTTESVLKKGDPRGLQPPQEDFDYLRAAADHNLNLQNPDDHLREVFCGVRTMPLKKGFVSSAPSNEARSTSENSSGQQDPFSSRWYVRSLQGNISALSRETVIHEDMPGLLSLYGGKYTTYRAQCEHLGSRVARYLGTGTASTTHSSESWFLEETLRESPHLFQSSAQVRTL